MRPNRLHCCGGPYASNLEPGGLGSIAEVYENLVGNSGMISLLMLRSGVWCPRLRPTTCRCCRTMSGSPPSTHWISRMEASVLAFSAFEFARIRACRNIPRSFFFFFRPDCPASSLHLLVRALSEVARGTTLRVGLLDR